MTATSTTSGTERRHEQRVPVRLPVCLRGNAMSGERFEIMTASVNFSRGGTAVATHYAFERGTKVEVTVYSSSLSHPEKRFSTHGRVTHVRPSGEPGKNIVGIRFTGLRFNRIFTRESHP